VLRLSSKYKNLISKIILISGPTASGKSKYAIKIAKRLNGEIVNADSMQIYKEIRVLNARPNKVYTKNIKHHLYGFHSVKKNFSTGKWLILAEQVIKKIIKKNKIPIVVGGTGLYFKALNYGLAKIPKVPKVIRNNIIKEQKKIGQKKFYKKLIKVDPIAKEKINQNDSQRSIRAYEVKKFTKKSIFEWFKKTKKIFPNDKFIKIYIDYPRLNLIKKIDLRIIRMLRSGAISEVKHFKKLRVSKDFTSNKIIGILEISEYLRRILRLQEAKDKISIKTRQYAKRQATWARGHMKDWHKVNDLKLKSFIKILNSYL
tara:strand:+ start:2574 stop:3518 length:945 start_codon:yes stop_codon:yes gene_type:complete